MLDLAQANPDEYTPIKEISEKEEISSKYLEQIIAVLNKAGYVKSVRGPQGGYKLAYPPEEYVVGDILRLTERTLLPAPCLEEGYEKCNKKENCQTIKLWGKINAAIKNVVDTTTLADLLSDEQ